MAFGNHELAFAATAKTTIPASTDMTHAESEAPKKNDAAMTCIEHLRAFAKPLGVSILLENIPNEFSAPEKLVEFIRAAHFEDVGICFDLGHAHMMSSVPEAFETVKEHIASAQAHDNSKDRDAHFWPGKGTIDWKETMGLLRSASDNLALILEIEAEDQWRQFLALEPALTP